MAKAKIEVKVAKHPGGRPRMELDERQIRELASIQCTLGEIASVMGCHVDTIRDRFSTIINEAREGGKSSLRRAQWNKAVKDGNPSMLIWLGKHYLDQNDEIKLSATQEPEVKKLMNKLEWLGRKSKEKEANENAA